ncbi:MAG: hypothetical protein IPK18_13920 [Sphingobacteriales bacterium]|jgi:hypothetical protein|nr:MAG: hypothetical protein IPK18_13920 [Sphingobacteriales bacterium]
MKKITLIMITLMTLLAISCKKEDTTTTFADEIKDYYIAIENAGNGFGLIYFKYHGSVLYAHYQDVKNDVNFANNSEGFKISGDSSITIVVDSKNTILLNFKRNSNNEPILSKCTTNYKPSVSIIVTNRYAEMYKTSSAPLFYVKNKSATQTIRYSTFSIYPNYVYSYTFSYINNPEIELRNVLFNHAYSYSVIDNNLGFVSVDADAIGISVPKWRDFATACLLVETKDEAGVDFRGYHHITIPNE